MKLLTKIVDLIQVVDLYFINRRNRKWRSEDTLLDISRNETREERRATPPTHPEISASFTVDIDTNEKVHCSYVPAWFDYNLENTFVSATYEESYAKKVALGYKDKSRFKLVTENFPSKEAFFEKYPEWRGRADCLHDRFLELVKADAEKTERENKADTKG